MSGLTVSDILADGFGRVRHSLVAVLDGIEADELTYQAGSGANTIAWLLWHLTRVQDDHISNVAGTEQLWTAGGWRDRFGLPLEPDDTGYGHAPWQVSVVKASAELLDGYHAAVHEHTLRYVATLTDGDLGRIVDERFDPPVTLGVRLVSVIDDDLEHVGQAAYVRGLARYQDD